MDTKDSQLGWIKLHRQIQQSEFWFSERFTKIQAWIDLLLLANHAPATFFIRGIEIHVERGQLAYAQTTLARRWKWNERTVARLIKLLEKRQMVQTKTDNVTTVITILNYSKYQDHAEQNTVQKTEQTNNRIPTNNNDENVKNEKKIINSSLEFEETFMEEMKSKFPAVDIDYELEKARDWLLSTGKRKKDYEAFFRNWLREAKPNPQKEEVIVI